MENPEVSFNVEDEFKKAEVWGKGQGIALKSLKMFMPMSEETFCFTTKIAKGDKVIGTAENNGKGGCTMVWLEQPQSFNKEEQNMLEIWVDVLVGESVKQKEINKTLKQALKAVKKHGDKYKTMLYKLNVTDAEIKVDYVGTTDVSIPSLQAEVQKRGEGWSFMPVI